MKHSKRQPDDSYLYYFNANVAEQLPHPLAFENLAGRLIVGRKASGQVYTVVGIGLQDHQHYLWSTFTVTECNKDDNGQYVLQGKGWQLCPPAVLDKKTIGPMVDSLAVNQFRKLPESHRGTWVGLAVKYRPPGGPYQIARFIQSILDDVVPGAIRQQMELQLKALGPVKPPRIKVAREQTVPVSNYVAPTPLTPTTEIRCLSIRQPHITDILAGRKTVENRDWQNLASLPVYRGWLALHASQTIDPHDPEDYKGETLFTGAILGLAHFDDIVTIDEYRKMCKATKTQPNEYAFGYHCLLLSKVIRLPEPIPMNGGLASFCWMGRCRRS